MTQFARPAAAPFRPGVAPARPSASPAPAPVSIFARLAAAGTSVQSNWLRGGDYLFRVDQISNQRTQMGKEALFVKLTTIHVFDNDQGRGHSVGEECTQAYWFHHKGFLERFNTTLVEMTGLPKEQIDEPMIESFLQQNSLGGCVVHWKGSQKHREGKDPLTIGKFSNVLPSAQVKEVLTPEEQARFFPNGLLDQLIAAEAEEQGAAPAA